MRILSWLLIAGTVLAVSCKKNSGDDNGGDNNNNPPAATQEQLLMDSVYLFTKEVYLWNTVLPTYDQFNPRQYTASTKLESAQKVMNAVRKLQPLDRFSFVTTTEESGGLQTGDETDWGFFLHGAYISETQVAWFVTYVYDQSSAGVAGVKRGWIIYKINGTILDDSDASINLLNEVFFGTTTSANFEFITADGSTKKATLSKTSFTANAVLHKSVIDAGGKKVGYLVFNQFFGAPARQELKQAFSYFEGQGITELVVDLRYNPGGSVQTQDTLADLIAPTAANGKTMYRYVFNQNLQNGNFPLLSTKPGFKNVSFSQNDNKQVFNKAGNLNLSRVFVIGTNGTASASELLINNLRPYMDVKLIGDTTYGKPVGFFPIDIFDFAIYPISFKTVNSAGNADYYTGFAPDKVMYDGFDKDWGDESEACLAEALKYITTGNFSQRPTSQGGRANKAALESQERLQPIHRSFTDRKFNGMFVEKK